MSKSLYIKENQHVICIKKYNPFEKGKKYKVIYVNDEHIIVSENDNYDNSHTFDRIKILEDINNKINETGNDDVKSVLEFIKHDNELESKIYFEDIFITQSKLRKLKLNKINV